MKKLKIEDLKLGMKVDIGQLSEVYDTWIFVELQKVGDPSGIIRFIGPKTNAESQKVWESCKVLAPIYHDSIELDPDIEFIG